MNKNGFVKKAAVLFLLVHMLLWGAWGQNTLTEGFAISAINAEAATTISINATNINLYGIDEWAEKYLEIPASCNTSFQLKVSGAANVSYSVVSGYSVTVSSTGVLEPSRIPCLSWATGTVSYVLETGTSTVRVTADGKIFDVTVNVYDYADVYADKVLEDYIAANVTSSMSDYQKIEQACKFAAGYDYSASYSGMTGMVVSGGGDCWASTDAIINFCEKVGLKAWARNGNKDYGAGSGHMNALVESDGIYYEAEAGYVGTAPRTYTITKRTSLYSYHVVNGGIEVYQYDGETMPENLVIPDSIDGYKVVGIGDSFIQMDSTIKTVSIPDTVQYIGHGAFNSCYALTTINLPEALTSIGNFAFTACTKLTNISCPASNTAFSVSNGVIYDKYKTTLICAPAVEKLTIPSTVRTIGYYSFYYNSNLKSVSIPSSVTAIEEGAFGNCTDMTSVRFGGDGLKTLDPFAFAYCNSLEIVTIPKTVTAMGENVFYGIADQITLYVKAGSTAETYAEENEISYQYNPFLDVRDAAYYAKAVAYMYDRNIMSGTTETTFSPSSSLTRGQVVTMLWNYEGYPIADISQKPFADVDTNKYYARAVAWAKSTGIINGYDNGNFGPTDTITRQDLACILRNYAKYKGLDITVSDVNAYKACGDYKNVSAYAKSSIQWAYCNGLIGANGKLSPKDKITRADAASMLQRFLLYYKI